MSVFRDLVQIIGRFLLCIGAVDPIRKSELGYLGSLSVII